MNKIVFLDIDGVLNGYDIKSKLLWKISDTLHISRLFHSVYDPFGVRTGKVFFA